MNNHTHLAAMFAQQQNEKVNNHNAAAATAAMASVMRFDPAVGLGGPGAYNRPNSIKNTIVLQPGPNDVLLGRGKETINYVGNVSFRGIIESLKVRSFCGTWLFRADSVGSFVRKGSLSSDEP